MKNKFRKFLKENQNKISLNIGEVILDKVIGEGGNGLVYEASFLEKKYALKFLLTDLTGGSKSRKIKRFIAEYFNVKELCKTDFIVKYIDFDKIVINDEEQDFEIPVILMKKYSGSLKSLHDVSDTTQQEKKFEDVFNFLLDSVESIHDEGIIHRDIKPENILVSENSYVLADFGIASYNPEQFKIFAETQKTERLGNRLFSSPEQENGGEEANVTMDIYAIGQILHWLIYNETHRGTNRKLISLVNPNLSIYDSIIDKCLSNDATDRFQNILEIREELVRILQPKRNLWYYLHKFGDVLVQSFPKNESGIVHSNDPNRIDYLFSKLKNDELIFVRNIDYIEENLIWWHDGSRNTEFKLTHKGNSTWKFDNIELVIKNVWIHYDLSFFNDFIVVNYEKGEPFIVDGKETFYTVVVDDKYQITYSEYENKFAEIEGKIVDLKNHKVEFIQREKKEGYMIIGTKFHCCLRQVNDKIVRDFFNTLLQQNGIWNMEQFVDFQYEIRKNKLEEIEESL